MPKSIKDQNGMTLIELMIGFAIFAILLALSMSIMLFGTKVLAEDSDQDRLKMVGDEMYTQLSDELRFATHIQVLPEGSDPDTAKYDNIILIQDGELLKGKKGGPYASPYQSDIYLNTKLTLSATVAESKDVLFLGLKFSRTKSGEEATVYSTDSAIRLINLAAGTDPVEIECNGTSDKDVIKNAVISYDSVPYGIEEEYKPDDLDDVPYTVARYTEKKDPVPLVDEDPYQPGDIVEITKGNKKEYWQVVEPITYDEDNPFMRPGQPWTSYWKSLDEEWNNHSGKSVYECHDVVSYGWHWGYYGWGHYGWGYYGGGYYESYYMYTDYDWVQVYWFPDHNDPDNRWMGWSLNKSSYVSAYETYD